VTAQPETAWTEAMRDAAFAGNIDPHTWAGAVGGYYGGPRALNMWTVADWARFPHHRKLPIWVGGLDGRGEGKQAVDSLRFLGVPQRAWTAVDMETRVDKTYLANFWNEVGAAGYRVWVYGSASTVFGNPQLDGYWVADYAGIGPFMFDAVLAGVEVRATQYAPGPAYDSSTVKAYTLDQGVWWI
jgi:hypothetical protein